MMAMFFAQRVVLGKQSFASVPTTLQAAVADILTDSGLAYLMEE